MLMQCADELKSPSGYVTHPGKLKRKYEKVRQQKRFLNHRPHHEFGTPQELLYRAFEGFHNNAKGSEPSPEDCACAKRLVELCSEVMWSLSWQHNSSI